MGLLLRPRKHALIIIFQAHRAILVRVLKNLENVVQMIYTDFELTENGWLFTGRNGSSDRDPLYGFAGLKQLYRKADPQYEGRYTVPHSLGQKDRDNSQQRIQ